jgi:nicotinate-nucleotide pyrophosphorylase (carboxylating)
MILTAFHQVRYLIQASIEEDLGRGDVTTEATIAAHAISRARLIPKQELVLAGMNVFTEVYAAVDNAVHIKSSRKDGDLLVAGTVIAELEGPARSLLAGERVALNFLQRLCGIATLTRRYIDAVSGYDVEIVDTRKTTPGWRLLEKYAVRVGGGKNHRHDLGDGILIKDNHIVAAGGIGQAVEMPPTLLAEGVKMIGGRALVEASGGISLESVIDVARTGVDLISVGRLTHSAPAADIHVEFDIPPSVS